jgi:DNA-binding GntR family transcriptional regulator
VFHPARGVADERNALNGGRVVTEWSGQPAYKQVAADLRGQISEGRLAVGSQLPSIASLMSAFGVSITVVRMALSELRNAGLITTHQGKGAFVIGAGTGTREATTSGLEAELRKQRAELRRLSKRVTALETELSSKAAR